MGTARSDPLHTQPAPEVAVVGAGYVGLVTAACLADLGLQVRCHDADPARLVPLEGGRPPFHEPGLAEVLQRGVASGRLRPCTGLPQALEGASFCFVAVGTPSLPEGGADLRHVWDVADSLAKHAAAGMIVVLRSTVPPGTGDRIAQWFQTHGRRDLRVVNAPEFLAEGTAVHDFLHPERLVFGGPPGDAARVAALFSQVRPESPRSLTTRTTAELAKYAANAFLAARVSLINEVAALCSATGADIREVSRLVGLDSRIGSKFLRPGIGYGGSCFPKDVRALVSLGRSLGIELPVVNATEQTNAQQVERAVATLRVFLVDPPRPRVAIWGIAFKPGTDDTRMAPGLAIADRLQALGMQVVMHDPEASLPTPQLDAGIRQAASALECVQGADALLVATEWPAYANVDPRAVRGAMRNAFVLDGRNCLDHSRWAAAGCTVRGIGVPAVAG